MQAQEWPWDQTRSNVLVIGGHEGASATLWDKLPFALLANIPLGRAHGAHLFCPLGSPLPLPAVTCEGMSPCIPNHSRLRGLVIGQSLGAVDAFPTGKHAIYRGWYLSLKDFISNFAYSFVCLFT